MSDGKIRVEVESRFPLFMEIDPDKFGLFFASLDSGQQVDVLAAMVKYMKPHAMQWDYISIELDKPENGEIKNQLRQTFFAEQDNI